MCITIHPNIIHIVGNDFDTRNDDDNQQTPTYRSDWAQSFSLPDEWVTKAIHETIASHRKGSFSIPMLNDLFEKVSKLRSSSYVQNLPLNSKQRKGDKDRMNNETSIFSEAFFDCCLRSYLGSAASKSWTSDSHETEENLSEDEIRQVLKDDRYRYRNNILIFKCYSIHL